MWSLYLKIAYGETGAHISPIFFSIKNVYVVYISHREGFSWEISCYPAIMRIFRSSSILVLENTKVIFDLVVEHLSHSIYWARLNIIISRPKCAGAPSCMKNIKFFVETEHLLKEAVSHLTHNWKTTQL